MVSIGFELELEDVQGSKADVNEPIDELASNVCPGMCLFDSGIELPSNHMFESHETRMKSIRP